MNLAKRCLCLAIAMTGMAVGSAKAELILNGGFENPPAPPGGANLYGGGSNIGG